jgi:integral membrane protein (TIGR01906 family)
MSQHATRILSLLYFALGLLAVWLFVFQILLHGYRPSEAYTVSMIYEYLLIEPYTYLPNMSFVDIKERRHLLDVKRLLIVAEWGSMLSLVVFLLLSFASSLFKSAANFFMLLSRMGKYCFWFNTFVAIAILIFFEKYFLLFHEVFFKQGTWIFRESGTLVNLFPLDFFQRFVFLFLFFSGLVFLLIWFGTVLLQKRKYIVG